MPMTVRIGAVGVGVLVQRLQGGFRGNKGLSTHFAIHFLDLRGEG